MRNHAAVSRSLIVGLVMLMAAPCRAQAPDAFQSAPGPVAPKPKPRPHAPPPEAAPTAVPPAAPASRPGANPPLALAPGQIPAGAFDGTYTGSVTGARVVAAGRHRNCISGGAVRMIIRSVAVFIEQSGRPDGGTANYRGTVDASGAVLAAASNPEGTIHTVAGKISQGRFSGEIRRSNCHFSVELVKG